MVSDENGNEVEVKDLKNIERGKTVKVIQKANTGYRFADIKAVDKVTNTPITVSGNFTFTMMSPVELTVTFEEMNEKFTVTTVNGKADKEEYSNREIATVTAGSVEGKKFSHWINTENGSIVSYDKTYTFLVLGNTNLEAVFIENTETVEKNPFVTMSNEVTSTKVGDKYRISFSGQFFLPKDCKLKEYGMILTPDKGLTVDMITLDSSIRLQKMIATNKNSVNQYVMNVNGVKPGVTRSGRMYVIYTDSNGVDKTMYSDTFATIALPTN